ncbi:uncharacterized protein LOC117119725, partial [Anneissia japonica]|uniref:uncharacterized protein LOC117119725 n=1 Tax=Anneissia japonica TaxID=1529436 RepID=UPI001425AAA1
TGEICGGTRVRFKGQCIGAVSSSHPDACHIFAEHSHKLKIDGVKMQSFLQNNFESVEIDSYRYYRIGVESSNDTTATSLRWHDATPLVYENWIEPPNINSNSTCVLLDRFSMLQWTTFDCATGNLIFATLCQFDLNECFGSESLCETCVNVPGSYYCSCPRGYLLHEKDGQECEDICHHHIEHTGSSVSLLQLNETCYTTDYTAVNSTTSKHLCSSMESLIEETDIQAITQLNVTSSWIDNNAASCTVLKAESNGSSVSNVSCSEEYPAV